MNLSIEPGVVLSLITIAAGVTIYAFIKGRHVERMLQLQMGIPIDKVNSSHFEIKFGLLFIGIGLGILTAFILNQILSKNVFEFYPAFIFIFGGLGLVISFFIAQKENRKNDFNG